MVTEALREEQAAHSAGATTGHPALATSERQWATEWDQIERTTSRERGQLCLGRAGHVRLAHSERDRLRHRHPALGDVLTTEGWQSVVEVLTHCRDALSRDRTCHPQVLEGTRALTQHAAGIPRGTLQHIAFLTAATSHLTDILQASGDHEISMLQDAPPIASPLVAAAALDLAELSAGLRAQSGGLVGAVSPTSCVQQARECTAEARDAASALLHHLQEHWPESDPAEGVGALSAGLDTCVAALRCLEDGAKDHSCLEWSRVWPIARKVTTLHEQSCTLHASASAVAHRTEKAAAALNTAAEERSNASRVALSNLDQQAARLQATLEEQLGLDPTPGRPNKPSSPRKSQDATCKRSSGRDPDKGQDADNVQPKECGASVRYTDLCDRAGGALERLIGEKQAHKARLAELEERRSRMEGLMEEAMEVSACAGASEQGHRCELADASKALQRLERGLLEIQGGGKGQPGGAQETKAVEHDMGALGGLQRAERDPQAGMEDAEADKVRAFEIAEALVENNAALTLELEDARADLAAVGRKMESIESARDALRELRHTRECLVRGLQEAWEEQQGERAALGAREGPHRELAGGLDAVQGPLEAAKTLLMMPWDVVEALEERVRAIREAEARGRSRNAGFGGVAAAEASALGRSQVSMAAAAVRYHEGESNVDSDSDEDSLPGSYGAPRWPSGCTTKDSTHMGAAAKAAGRALGAAHGDPSALQVLLDIGFDYNGGCRWLPWSRFAPSAVWAFDPETDDWARPIPRPLVHFFGPSGEFMGSCVPGGPDIDPDPAVRRSEDSEAAGRPGADARARLLVGSDESGDAERLGVAEGGREGRRQRAGVPGVGLDYVPRTLNGAAAMVYWTGLAKRALQVRQDAHGEGMFSAVAPRACHCHDSLPRPLAYSHVPLKDIGHKLKHLSHMPLFVASWVVANSGP